MRAGLTTKKRQLGSCLSGWTPVESILRPRWYAAVEPRNKPWLTLAVSEIF